MRGITGATICFMMAFTIGVIIWETTHRSSPVESSEASLLQPPDVTVNLVTEERDSLGRIASVQWEHDSDHRLTGKLRTYLYHGEGSGSKLQATLHSSLDEVEFALNESISGFGVPCQDETKHLAGGQFVRGHTGTSSAQSPIAGMQSSPLPILMTGTESEVEDSSEMAGSVRQLREQTGTWEDDSERGNGSHSVADDDDEQRDDEFVFEAEDASSLTPYFGIEQDASASGSKYIGAPETNTTQLNERGVAEYRFEVHKAGVYKVIARVFAPTNGSDSFYIRMDNGSRYTWDLPEYPDWTWVTAGTGGSNELTFRLAAGQHVLWIGNREDGTRLDILVISRISD